MGFLSSLIIGAVMGVAGTWAYFRSRLGAESADSAPRQAPAAVVEEAAEKVVEEVVEEAAAVEEAVAGEAADVLDDASEAVATE